VGYAGLLDLGYVAFAWVPVVGLAGSPHLAEPLPASRHSRAAPAHLAIHPGGSAGRRYLRRHLGAPTLKLRGVPAIVTLGLVKSSACFEQPGPPDQPDQ
jgi:ABC-type branched-subunit amino acid transport system permease subunit